MRALTRIGTPQDEAVLVNMAREASAHQVERMVRDQLRIRRGRPAEACQPELMLMEADDGTLTVRGRLPKELGLLLKAALDTHEVRDDVPIAQQRAEALLLLAESQLSAQPVSSADRYLVHIDHDDPDLSEAARARLTCDGSVVVHGEDESGELTVGRKTRSIPPALRRALRRRDRGCRYPGCTHTRFVDAHHVRHWAHGGETALSNLVLLCRRHHRVIHESKAEVAVVRPPRGAVQFRFVDASGAAIRATGEGGCTNVVSLEVIVPSACLLFHSSKRVYSSNGKAP